MRRRPPFICANGKYMKRSIPQGAMILYTLLGVFYSIFHFFYSWMSRGKQEHFRITDKHNFLSKFSFIIKFYKYWSWSKHYIF